MTGCNSVRVKMTSNLTGTFLPQETVVQVCYERKVKFQRNNSNNYIHIIRSRWMSVASAGTQESDSNILTYSVKSTQQETPFQICNE